MTRTQVHFPDDLYHQAKRIAREQEMSFAEVIRRGLEMIVRLYPPGRGSEVADWEPPEPLALGAFRASSDQWRELANEPGP
ncbi:MAG: antitoxin [Thermoanaerobaculia bacterium]|nr:antitoxin [Thermoanaerobaculia bacterium]